MFVRELALTDFRSWDRVELELEPGPTIFVGRNGFGKTNLLESLFYVATLRSHRVSGDGPLVRTGATAARVFTTVHNEGRELSVDLTIAAQGANKAQINTAPVRRTREILGILRTVLFAPEDLALVRGDPGERRRFLDEIVVQLRPLAAGSRADYERVLRQRSALLKTAGAAMRRSSADADSVMSTLDVWDEQLAQFGAEVTADRLAVIAQLDPLVTQAYASIAPHSRPAHIAYRSAAGPEVDASPGGPAAVEEIRQILAQRLHEVRSKEIDRGLCLIGPHRDDLFLGLGTEPAKGFASHGESWSFALALRLACVDLLRTDGVEPVIMLDDVFAELDTARRQKLAEFTASAEQLLITAAVGEDIPQVLAGRRISVGVQEHDGVRRSVILDDHTVAEPSQSRPQEES
ncbi:DNA replication and repair protein RecF [Gordonia hirsuta DSM 44140 = NBRC 16056]|uniref:DNA replication and repair protein RecF n=1 Tax=Gordonia hirsuta DSM 44140 = NBRC 16056 TaxID=1121927 RepID=L7LAE4_9ACTN|nr:DNA replication/repair protein RecF [Gordonia hirsuta]GAC57731.1 DNA replication and repair protein RecF [Gordonia hirsuta DSM 44140 = NBRC 16056]